MCCLSFQLNTEWTQIEVIDLMNDGTGLGFGIIGGRSTGVVVKTILPGGVADAVCILDILSWGGLDWDLVLLGVRVPGWLSRQYYLEEWQMRYVYLISCLGGTGLGFGIIGGKSTGVVVKTILPGGVADAVRILDILSWGDWTGIWYYWG